MTDLNHVVLMGRVTRDLDEKDFSYIGNGNAKLNLSIAVNRSVKRGDEWQDEVSYFNVTYWGKPAEAIKQYIYKGLQVTVDGYLKQDRWEKDGQKHSNIGIVADHVYLCGGKRNDNSSHAQPQAQDNGNSFPEDICF